MKDSQRCFLLQQVRRFAVEATIKTRKILKVKFSKSAVGDFKYEMYRNNPKIIGKQTLYPLFLNTRFLQEHGYQKLLLILF